MAVLVVVFCRLFPDVHQMSCFRLLSSHDLLVSSLPHASGSETKMWKRVFLFLFARNLGRRVRSRQLNSVSWMLLQCSPRRRRPVPIERRGDETLTRTENNPTNPLYKNSRGMNSLVRNVCQVRVQNKNVQPLYFNHCPGHPLIISIKPRLPSHAPQNTISPVHCINCNQPSPLHAKSKSLEYHTTSTPPL